MCPPRSRATAGEPGRPRWTPTRPGPHHGGTTGTDAATRYETIAEELAPHGARRSQMFGMPCLKDPTGKASAGLTGDEPVCRPGRDSAEHTEALAPAGAHLFDPAGGRPRKDRVRVPDAAGDRWQRYAEAALAAPR
ncbi:hypothetical protein ABZW30_09520 [Kitasatospora sp. NPDC004669]|uniref:hypothetical protein n=1 Tax=Kitasatospora sp. NPDC004669 TaxID=3154555 RepID=UPI0033A26E45